MRSTDVDRTLMSAQVTLVTRQKVPLLHPAHCVQAQLAGLYPPRPGSDNEWNPALAWQPVPVHTVAQASRVDISYRYFMHIRYLVDITASIQAEDALLSSDHTACPRLTRLRAEARTSAEVRRQFAEHRWVHGAALARL